MSKPTLGRGLGDLLGTRRSPDHPGAPPQKASMGLRILIDGAPQPDEATTVPARSGAKERAATAVETRRADDATAVRVVAVTALISADVALVCWTMHFAFTHQDTLGFVRVSGCTLSILVAALCGCTAVVLRHPYK